MPNSSEKLVPALEPKETPSDSVHYNIDLRLFFGFVAGICIAAFIRLGDENGEMVRLAREVSDPIGKTFLRVFLFAMAPFIFASIATAIANLTTMGSIKRMTSQIVVYYATTTMIAIIIGQTLVSLIQPGLDIPRAMPALTQDIQIPEIDANAKRFESVREFFTPLAHFASPQALRNGKMIFIFIVAIIVGLFTMSLPKQPFAIAIYLLRTLSYLSSKLIDFLMHFAPVGVACITVNTMLRVDMTYIRGIAEYAVIVIAGCFLHQIVVFSAILKFWVKYPPREFFSRARPAILAAAFARSTNIVIPVTSETLEKRFGVPRSITSLTVPLGANFNLDGTALYEVVTVLFLAQIFRVQFTPWDHVALVFFVMMTSIGLPGIPGSGFPILTAVLATLDIPVEGIAIVIGVDGILGMVRTAVNITGDMIGTLFVCRRENLPLLPEKKPRRRINGPPGSDTYEDAA